MSHGDSGIEYTFGPFFSLRVPLFPFKRIREVFDKVPESMDEPHSLPRSGGRIRRDTVVQRLLSDRVFREAITLASPDLSRRLDELRLDELSTDDERVARTLSRYWLRAASRATPFGLFGSTATGTPGPETRLEVAPPAAQTPVVRVDQGLIAGVVSALVQDDGVRRFLAYEVNSSAYKIAGQIRYVERRYSDKGQCEFELAAVDASDDLDAILSKARSPVRFRELVSELKKTGVSSDDATDFIEQLIAAQVLVPTIEPPLVGINPLEHLHRELSAALPNHPVVAQLVAIQHELTQLSNTSPGCARAAYDRTEALIQALPKSWKSEDTFDIQLPNRNSDVRLGPRFWTELRKALGVLEACRDPLAASTNDGVRDELEAFRAEFVRRFEHQSVPLAIALDDETGIGFRGAWNQEPSNSDRRAKPSGWTSRDAFLAQRLCQAIRTSDRELVLTKDDVARIAALSDGQFPPLRSGRNSSYSFLTMARVEAANGEALDQGDFSLYVALCIGTHSSAVFGRFCSADSRLDDFVRSELRENAIAMDDALTAEIAHLPQPRMANVISRPDLQQYQIPYLARSGSDSNQTFDLNDLHVCVEDMRVVLWSKRLGREIVPQLTCAHAAFHENYVPVYRFLAALQVQDERPTLTWSWGSLASMPFLPRVVHQKTVLCLARWRLSRLDVDNLAAAARRGNITLARAELLLPRMVSLAQGDNVLPIDLDSDPGMAVLVDAAREQEDVLVTEMFPSPSRLAVTDGAERYTHELLIPTRANIARGANHQRSAAGPRRRRFPLGAASAFLPGSEWTFVKIYGGEVTLERLLLDIVRPFADDLISSRQIDRWFYIRYGDPHYHLRVRFHGSPAVVRDELVRRLTELLNPFVAGGSVHAVQLDTYKPETERYGGPLAMRFAEDIFQADSIAVTSILSRDGNREEDRRLLACMLCVYRAMHDAELPAPDMVALARGLKSSHEQGAPSRLSGQAKRKELAIAFRTRRASIKEALDFTAQDRSQTWRDVDQILDLRTASTRDAFVAIADLERSGSLTCPKIRILASLIHMHINRFMPDLNARREHDLYDFMGQHLASEEARRQQDTRVRLADTSRLGVIGAAPGQ